MYTKIIGVLHLGGMIWMNVYGFLFQHERLDQIYMVFFALLPLSWIIFQDECLISYLVKKVKNPNYVLGKETETGDEIEELFDSEALYRVFYTVGKGLRIGSLWLVHTRNIPHTLFLLPMVTMFWEYDTYKKESVFRVIFGFTLCVYLIIVFATIH